MYQAHPNRIFAFEEAATYLMVRIQFSRAEPYKEASRGSRCELCKPFQQPVLIFAFKGSDAIISVRPFARAQATDSGHSRSWAFEAMSRIVGGSFSLRLMKLAVDGGRHALSPSAFDQHSVCQHIASLGDAPALKSVFPDSTRRSVIYAVRVIARQGRPWAQTPKIGWSAEQVYS